MRLLMLFLLVSQITVGQTYFKDHFGGTIGVVANFGTHYNSIGLNIKGYYSDYFYQFNAGTTLYFHHNHYGNRKRFIENRNSLGLILLGGKRETIRDFQLDGLRHRAAAGSLQAHSHRQAVGGEGGTLHRACVLEAASQHLTVDPLSFIIQVDLVTVERLRELKFMVINPRSAIGIQQR